MITHIRVKNFKSWKDSGDVKLAPLTGFFGTNSSGKSSLLQMLLFLKQAAADPDPQEVIFLGDENSLVNLGNFREVIHGHKKDESLELEFGCKPRDPFVIEGFEENSEDSITSRSTPINKFSFKTILRGSEQPYIEYVRYGLGSPDIKEVKWERETHSWSYPSPSGKEKTPVVMANCYRIRDMYADNVLRPLFSAFEELFSHVYYLGATRVHPKRHYHWDDKDPTDVGLWGDKVIDALLCAHMRRVKISKKGEEVTIEDRVSEWLREMDLAYSFSLEPIGALQDDNHKVQIRKSAMSPAVTLADMGYGLADVLPMLVLCYYTPEGSTLILEQPGIHLHPKAQADLADLLIEVITERNLQILVESHSEHLLTRLQLRIAEQQIAAKDTALYFCENENGVSTIKSLEVDELGNIKNWPKNFFGNVRGDLVKMTREQMKREKEAEGA